MWRWLSRDPIGEQGFYIVHRFDEEDFPARADWLGENLYRLLGNDPVDAVDRLGLWKWIGGKRQGGFRAKLLAENYDSVASLAPKAWLEASQSELWLRDWNDNPVRPSDSIASGCPYSVPNIVYIEQEPGPFWLMGYPVSEINRLTSQGFFAIHRRNPDVSQIRSDFADRDLFGLIFSGHGDPDRKGELLDWDDYLLHPNNVAVHHKLGGIKIVSCYGGVLDWNRFLSAYGSYWAKAAKVYYWDVAGIQRGFPYPYD